MNIRICCICIPIYKNEISKTESLSLRQCLKILNNYDIYFITHKGVKRSQYDKICSQHGPIKTGYKYFPRKFFRNIDGYNSLLLSQNFYLSFSEYKYILIYQLDAFVFSDQLIEWCNKKYDYIGAPWLVYHGPFEGLDFQEKPIGNGGFSLRKLTTFCELYSKRIRFAGFLHSINSKCIYYSKKRSFFPVYPFINILIKLIRKIILKLFFDPYTPDNNEDKIWSRKLYTSGCLPSQYEAIKFSFENYPEYLFELNNNKLPFGCHGWESYDNFLFWKRYIKLNV
jgi:hypothetical protein